MSLEELDALLNTPVGQKVKRKKKRRKKKSPNAKSSLLMNQIEEATARVQNWQLSAEPTVTLLVVQHTICTGCGTTSEATISAPMTGYTDRLNRTRYQPTIIPYRQIPIKLQRVEVSVPICHHCYASAPTEDRTLLVDSKGTATTGNRQLSFPFNSKEPEEPKSKSLIPLSQTPQAMLWIFHAMAPYPSQQEIYQ